MCPILRLDSIEENIEGKANLHHPGIGIIYIIIQLDFPSKSNKNTNGLPVNEGDFVPQVY